MQSPNSNASATSRNPLRGSSDMLASARKRIFAQSETGNRGNLQIVERTPEKPPTPPAASAWIPRGDRNAIVDAFRHGVRIHVLVRRQRRTHLAIETTLRDHIDELEGRIRDMQMSAGRRRAA